MTEQSAGLPSPERVIELLGTEFARAGYEIEDVSIDTGTRPPRIRIIADGDRPLNLDGVAELSRLASERLDAVDTGDTAYDLEVSSPGVDRPLTAENIFAAPMHVKSRWNWPMAPHSPAGSAGSLTGWPIW